MFHVEPAMATSGRLKLVSVPSLPTSRAGFIDCADAVGCGIGAPRLNTNCEEEVYVSCSACRHLLMHHPGRGWHLKENSREEISERREEARERNRPEIGLAWQALRKMRKVA